MSNLGSLVNFGVTRARFATILIIIVNAFTWYLAAFEVLAHMVDNISITTYETTMIWTIHFGGVACAALVGATLSNRLISRNNLLKLWMFSGVVSSLVPMIIGTNCTITIVVFSLLLGVTFGLGMPSCMGYFADFTTIEKRGWFGGVIHFVIGIGTFLLWTTLIPLTRLAEQLMILAIWRGFGLTTFLVLRSEIRHAKATKTPPYTAILRRKAILFYLIPWIMFCLTNSLTRPIFPPDVVRTSIIIGSIIIGLFSLVGGLFSDLIGRKRVVIAGFVMLGIGYAILGIFPNQISYYFFTVVSGSAWGMLGVVFVVVLWGDLAEGMIPEKYYAIGGLPYLLSGFLEVLAAPYLSELISPTATFSFASFFLFLAVVPLLFAPETLPEKITQEKRLRKYIEDAKKVKKKSEKRR